MAKGKSQREIEKETLVQEAEYGTDALAAAALRDMAEEDGEVAHFTQADGMPEPWHPSRGDWVVILTGAFFHCGRLLGIDHEQYYLDANSVIIDETGDFKVFLEQGICNFGEEVTEFSVVRKGPTTQVIRWPFDRVCTIANRN